MYEYAHKLSLWLAELQDTTVTWMTENVHRCVRLKFVMTSETLLVEASPNRLKSTETNGVFCVEGIKKRPTDLTHLF